MFCVDVQVSISEDLRSTLNAFLYRTGESSRRWALVFAFVNVCGWGWMGEEGGGMCMCEWGGWGQRCLNMQLRQRLASSGTLWLLVLVYLKYFVI